MVGLDGKGSFVTGFGRLVEKIIVMDTERPGEHVHRDAQLLVQPLLGLLQLNVNQLLELCRRQLFSFPLKIGMPEGMGLDVEKPGLFQLPQLIQVMAYLALEMAEG